MLVSFYDSDENPLQLSRPYCALSSSLPFWYTCILHSNSSLLDNYHGTLLYQNSLLSWSSSLHHTSHKRVYVVYHPYAVLHKRSLYQLVPYSVESQRLLPSLMYIKGRLRRTLCLAAWTLLFMSQSQLFTFTFLVNFRPYMYSHPYPESIDGPLT